MIVRNGGYIDQMLGKLRLFFFSISRTITTDDSLLETDEVLRRQLSTTIKISQQYLIVDLVALFAIPAQFYVLTSFDPYYPLEHGFNTHIIYLSYILIFLVRGLSHVIIYFLLQRRADVVNAKTTDGVQMEEYFSILGNIVKKYGLFFTLMSFVSTRDGYIGASAIFNTIT
jgi:hypothetical protein